MRLSILLVLSFYLYLVYCSNSRLVLYKDKTLVLFLRPGTHYAKMISIQPASHYQQFEYENPDIGIRYVSCAFTLDSINLALVKNPCLATDFIFDNYMGRWRANNGRGSTWVLHFVGMHISFLSPIRWFYYRTDGKISYGHFSSMDTVLHIKDGALRDPSMEENNFIAFSHSGMGVSTFQYCDYEHATNVDIDNNGYPVLKWKNPVCRITLISTVTISPSASPS